MRVATLQDYIFGGALRVPSRDFQGESLRSDLHWLCLAMALLKELFLEFRLPPGCKPRSWIGRRRRLCTVSFLKALLLFYVFWVLYLVVVGERI